MWEAEHSAAQGPFPSTPELPPVSNRPCFLQSFRRGQISSLLVSGEGWIFHCGHLEGLDVPQMTPPFPLFVGSFPLSRTEEGFLPLLQWDTPKSYKTHPTPQNSPSKQPQSEPTSSPRVKHKHLHQNTKSRACLPSDFRTELLSPWKHTLLIFFSLFPIFFSS